MKNEFIISPMKDSSYVIDVLGVVRVKPWISTAIGAGLGVASSIIGGISSAGKMKKVKEEMNAQSARNQAWYNRRYNENYADTAAGQNLLTQAKDYAKQNWKKAQGSAAVGGATDSATAQAKEAGNKVVSNTMSNIAAQDTARKSNVDNQYRQIQQNESNARVNLGTQEAAGVSQVAGSASDALMKAGSAAESISTSSTVPNVSSDTTKPNTGSVTDYGYEAPDEY